MRQDDMQKLIDDIQAEILRGSRPIGILSVSDATVAILSGLSERGLLPFVDCIYHTSDAVPAVDNLRGVPVRPLAALAACTPPVIAVGADEDKEDVVAAALPYMQGCPKLIVAGYGHYAFRDRMFHDVNAQLLVPSMANGYSSSLIHLYQCLVNAARLGLDGAVAEFGVFKGGTTMFIATVLKRLGVRWPVLGFDTFSGFPPRRSPLDMYDNADCVFTDRAAVEAYLSSLDVEIIAGDIVDTCHRLAGESLVTTFFDTDNYSPTTAALEVVRERTVVNGAIVFDHFTGEGRFRYTLGERFAGRVLLNDERYFNLHGTGVFFRQR